MGWSRPWADPDYVPNPHIPANSKAKYIEIGQNFVKSALLYYGYPISINKAWNVDRAAAIYEKYDIIVLGGGYENPNHESHSDTKKIIDKLRKNVPEQEIFGYVEIGQRYSDKLTMAQIKTCIDNWKAIKATGIFLDEFGFDYQITREWQNEVVNYCHSLGFNVMVNSWKVDYIFSKANIWVDDINFYGNPNGIEPVLKPTDYFMFEHLFYEIKDDIQIGAKNSRILETIKYYQTPSSDYNGMSYYEKFKVKTIALDEISHTDPNNELYFTNGFFASKVLNIDAYCASVLNWGSRVSEYVHYNPPIEISLINDKKHYIDVKSSNGISNAKFIAEIKQNNLEFTWEPDQTDVNNLSKGLRQIKWNGVVKNSLR